MSTVLEVRFDCTMHDLSETQVFGLLRAFPDADISVGLGYGGAAAAVVLGVVPDEAEVLGEQIGDVAHELGLQVALAEVLSTDEYVARALAEVQG